MANFYVGQRVRRVRVICNRVPLGAVGTITGERYQGAYKNEPMYPVRWDGLRAVERGWHEDTLAPLTDPSADRFIESIKRLGREPINDAPKVTVAK